MAGDTWVAAENSPATQPRTGRTRCHETPAHRTPRTNLRKWEVHPTGELIRLETGNCDHLMSVIAWVLVCGFLSLGVDYLPIGTRRPANVVEIQSAMKEEAIGMWSMLMCSVPPSSSVKIRSSRLGELLACS